MAHWPQMPSTRNSLPDTTDRYKNMFHIVRPGSLSGPPVPCNLYRLSPISSSVALVAQYWSSGFEYQPGYLPFWLRRVSFYRDFTGRFFRCAPNLFNILTCSPVNAFISSPFSKWHNSGEWIYCTPSDDKSRTLVTQTTDSFLCSAVWVPEAVPLNCGCRSVLRVTISVLALYSRSSKWMHPEGCCPIRNSRYCDEATGRNIRGLNSGRSKRYFSSRKSLGRLWYPPSRLFN